MGFHQHYHDDGEEDVESVEDRNRVLALGSHGLPSEPLEDVPGQHEHEEQVETEVAVEETPGI